MGMPVASGLTTHTGTYTPEIWSMKTLIKFYTVTVFAAISNTDYEGEIKKYGDVVQIRTIPDIVINDYTVGQDLQVDRPKPGKISLFIDKGKYYNVSLNDVEVYQSDLDYINKWSDDAAEQMKIQIDSGILADVYADAHASNKGNSAGKITGSLIMGATGAPAAVTKGNILDYIVDMGTVLDEQDVPEQGRWIVIPAIFCGLIKKSDLKDASLAGDATSIMRNGLLGMIDRFMIYKSNQIATTTDSGNTVYNSIFGQMNALTFAAQLVKNEVIKNQKDFGDLMRGLNVYGYETIKPEAMGHFYARKG